MRWLLAGAFIACVFVSVTLADSAKQQKIDDDELDAKFHSLRASTQAALKDLDLQKLQGAQDYQPLVDKIDELMDQLKKERQQVLDEQAERHDGLTKYLNEKEAKCEESRVKKAKVDLAISDVNDAKEHLSKYKQELLVAISIESKNKAANDAVRAGFANERVLLRQLLSMVDRIHNVTNIEEKESHLKQIRSMMTLLQTPSEMDKTKMSALDVGRVHSETMTLTNMLQRMIDDMGDEAKVMREQEKRDNREVARVNKVYKAAELALKAKKLARKNLQKIFKAALKKCDQATGEYSERMHLIKDNDAENVKDIGVINKELSVMGEMKRRIWEITHLPELQRRKAAVAAKAKAIAEKLAKATAEEDSFAKAEAKREAAALKKEQDELAAQEKAVADEKAKAQAEAQKAEERASTAATVSEAKAKAASSLAAKAKLAAKAEHTRQARIAAKEAKEKANAAKKQARQEKKSLHCIHLCEQTTVALMGFKYAPSWMVKQCVGLTGDDDAITAGLTRLVKGSKVYTKRKCRHVIKTLFHKLVKRAPDAEDMQKYGQLCVHGASNAEIARRIKQTPEYQEIIETPELAKSCLKHVKSLYVKLLGRQGESTGILFWSKKCMKGMSVKQIEAKFREMPAHVAFLKRKAAEARALKEQLAAKKQALELAKARAKRTLWEQEHSKAMHSYKNETDARRQEREDIHRKMMAEIKAKTGAYHDWFKKWVKLAPKKRDPFWNKMVSDSQHICKLHTAYCDARHEWLKKYRETRERLALYVRRYNEYLSQAKAAKKKGDAETAKKLEDTAKRYRTAAAKFAPMVKSVRLNREKHVKACRAYAVKCRVVVHRYHVILRDRVEWMKKRLAVWQTRAAKEHKMMLKSEGESRQHFKLARDHALATVKKIREELHKLAERRAQFAHQRKARREEAWEKTVAEWKKNLHCANDARQEAETYSSYFHRAIRAAKAAVHTRHRVLAAAQTTTGKKRSSHIAAANKALKMYRKAVGVAKSMSEHRLKFLREAAQCQHRSIYLLSRARVNAQRRARILAERRLALLKRAKAALSEAKARGAKPEELAAYKVALKKAHDLALRAHTALKRAHDLAAKAKAQEKADIKQQEQHEKAEREEAAERLKEAAKQAVEVGKARAARLREEQAAAEKRRDEWVARKNARMDRDRDEALHTDKPLFKSHRAVSWSQKAEKASAQDEKKAKQQPASHKMAIATATGDPHIETLQGHHLLLNADGDFVLFAGDDFEVQGRAAYIDKAIGATGLTAVAVKLPGHEGDVVEISHSGIALNRVTRSLPMGRTELQGGSIFLARDKNHVPLVKISMDNGMFFSTQVETNGALNVVAAVPANKAGGLKGLFNAGEQSSLTTMSLDEGTSATFRSENSLFVQPRSDSDHEVQAQKTVDVETMNDAQTLCRSAFSNADVAWRKCQPKCVKESAKSSGHCVIDTSNFDQLSEPERRACSCLFDVAAAGKPWAKVSADGFSLKDQTKKSS